MKLTDIHSRGEGCFLGKRVDGEACEMIPPQADKYCGGKEKTCRRIVESGQLRAETEQRCDSSLRLRQVVVAGNVK